MVDLGTPTYTTDFGVDAQRLARQQALAEALLARGGQAPQGQMVGNHFVAPSWTQELAAAVTPLAGAYELNKVGERQKALSGQYRQALGQAVNAYFAKANGTPAMTSNAPQIAGQLTMGGAAPTVAPAGTVTLGVAPDSKGALISALTSQFPELQAIAQQQMAAQIKGEEPYTLKAGEARYIGGQKVPGTGGPEHDFQDVGNGMYRDRISGEIKFAPKGTSISLGDIGPKAFDTENAKLIAQRFDKLTADAGSARQTLELADKLRKLDEAGTFVGPMAGPQGFILGLSQQLGVPLDKSTVEKLGNSQTYNSAAMDALVTMIQSRGGARGYTKEETEGLLKPIVPNLSTSPQARQQLYAIMEGKARNVLAQYDKARQVEATNGLEGLRAFDWAGVPDLSYQTAPALPTGGGGQTLRFDRNGNPIQ